MIFSDLRCFKAQISFKVSCFDLCFSRIICLTATSRPFSISTALYTLQDDPVPKILIRKGPFDNFVMIETEKMKLTDEFPSSIIIPWRFQIA